MPLLQERTQRYRNAWIVKSQIPQALIGKGTVSASAVAWTMYRKYANVLLLYRQEKDWKQYGAQISQTTLANWIIYCSQNYFQPMYDYFHWKLLKRSFAMADETRIQVLKEEGRRAQTQSFMWLFRSGEDGLAEIILYGFPRPGAAAMQESFWKVTEDIWKRTAIRVITICRGSDAVPVGHISVATLLTRFPKESSMTTASRQYRESSTETGYSPLRTPLTKSIPVIMKSGNSCVSRRKNRFWRLSGRGLTSKSP